MATKRGLTKHEQYLKELAQLSAEQGGRSKGSILRELVHREWVRTHPEPVVKGE
jgi:hypothetical protein